MYDVAAEAPVLLNHITRSQTSCIRVGGFLAGKQCDDFSVDRPHEANGNAGCFFCHQ